MGSNGNGHWSEEDVPHLPCDACLEVRMLWDWIWHLGAQALAKKPGFFDGIFFYVERKRWDIDGVLTPSFDLGDTLW